MADVNKIKNWLNSIHFSHFGTDYRAYQIFAKIGQLDNIKEINNINWPSNGLELNRIARIMEGKIVRKDFSFLNGGILSYLASNVTGDILYFGNNMNLFSFLIMSDRSKINEFYAVDNIVNKWLWRKFLFPQFSDNHFFYQKDPSYFIKSWYNNYVALMVIDEHMDFIHLRTAENKNILRYDSILVILGNRFDEISRHILKTKKEIEIIFQRKPIFKNHPTYWNGISVLYYHE